MAFVESEVVELKAEVVGDICKEVIAFANTKGGNPLFQPFLLFGLLYLCLGR